MAKTELSKSKSICVLAVVICCFAILWPKIFLPMFQSALSLSSAQNDNQRRDPTMLPPKVREAMKLSRPEEMRKISARSLHGEPQINTNEIPRTGGLMGLVMPIYTIGIVVFFVYTVLRMVFNKKSDKEAEELNEEETNKPIINDFKIDPEYRKFILSDEYDENGKRIKCYPNIQMKTNSNLRKNTQKPENVLQNFGKDKVSKALHVLIRDMEEFKAKLLEVEQTKRQIKEIGSVYSKQNKPNVCQNESQNDKNEDSNENEIHLNEEKDENLVKDIENEVNKENCEQMENELNVESEDESNVENEVNDGNDYPNPEEEYELKKRLLQDLESDYWESLLKGMKSLKHAKEE